METIFNLKYDIVCNNIIYDSPLPLRQLASVKIAINFWNKEKVIKKWEVAHRRIQGKVPSLTIPKCLKENLALMAELVGDQLNNFDELVKEILNFRKKWQLLKELIHWTTQGTINKKRTLETFADCKELLLKTRFKLALKFYLENQINSLSVKLSPSFIYEFDEIRFPSLYELKGASTARQHFGILSGTVPDYLESFSDDVMIKHEIKYHFYWQQLTEQEKRHYALSLYNPYELPDITLFVFTQHEKELNVLLLQNKSAIRKLLVALLDLRWLPFFVACMNEISSLLKPKSVIKLLYACVGKLDSTFAYKPNYAQECARLAQLLYSKKTDINDTLDTRYNINRIVILLFKHKEWNSLEVFFRCLIAEDRNKMISYLKPSDLESWFANSLKCGTLNSTIDALFPSFDEKESFLSSEKFVDIVSSLIEKKQLRKLDKIFASLCSNLDDIGSCKKQFAEEKGFELCQKFYDGNWECIDNFMEWNFSSQDEIDSFYKNTLQTAMFRLRLEQTKMRKVF